MRFREHPEIQNWYTMASIMMIGNEKKRTNYSRQDVIIANKEKCTQKGTSFLAIILLIALGVALCPNLAFADKDNRPFEAEFTIFVPAGQTSIVGQGKATHLGRMDIEFIREFASAPSPINPCVTFQYMVVTITAANGDELWMDYSDGELCVDFSNFPVITFVGDVGLSGTGGTGRFAESNGDYRLLWEGEIAASGTINYGVISGVIGY
jgi:hypothetical protein